MENWVQEEKAKALFRQELEGGQIVHRKESDGAGEDHPWVHYRRV